MTVRIDLHEPEEALPLFSQAVSAEVDALNAAGYADYYWEGYDSAHQWERKQWGELTNGLDRIEYQLREEMAAHPEAKLGLIVEGVCTPSMGGVQLWSRSRGRDVWYKTREQNSRYVMLMSWLHQVGQFMEVHYTPDYKSTVMALTAFYQSDQKDMHGTFHRHLKTVDWHPNPQIEMLMAIGHGIGIGAAKAEQIVRQMGTVWNVLNSSPEELQKVNGVGPLLARRILRKVGRGDV